MTSVGPDPTTELPAATGSAAAKHAGGDPLADAEVDRLLADLAEPVPERPLLTDRILAVWRELSDAPWKAALCTTWAFAAVVLAATWISQPVVGVQTSLGPARVNCGIDVFVYGYPDRSVSSACTRVEATHFALFIAAALIVVAGLLAAVVVAGRHHLRRQAAEGGGDSFLARLWAAPWAAALAGLGVVAAVVGLFALRPVPELIVRGGELLTVRCGADTYFGSYPDSGVRSVCGHAYAGHAHLLEVAALLTVLGMVAVLQVAYSASDRWRRRRLTSGLAAGVLFVVAIVALAPVEVQISAGPTPVVANCGIDAYLAGYPDHAVQAGCRAHFAGHAAVGLTAAALAVAVIGGGLSRFGRRRDSTKSTDLELTS